ncbi:MAG: o-succinylbenzoate synthase, partial [Bacillota bacterium]
MKIERVEMRLVSMVLKESFTTSFGTVERKEFIVITAHAGGIRGYGEVAALPAPLYSYETTGTSWVILEQFLVPAVLGREWSHPAELPRFWKHLRGHGMAKCGLEQAAWCAWAEAQGVSLARALGGTHERVEVGVSIGIQPTPARLLQLIEDYLGQGYRRIKVKIKPGWDVGVVREVRRRFGDIPLMVDANSAYTLADAAHLQRLDEFGLMMIEQPLEEDDLVDHATLQRSLRTPVCLDESITSPAAGRKALDLGSCRIINIKVGRVG